MVGTAMAKFFTWIDKTYAEPAAVPLALRTQIRALWVRGARPDELAATFKLPLDWVADFALDVTLDEPPALN
jgi:hypothetical protein